jgi:hypothetical protein
MPSITLDLPMTGSTVATVFRACGSFSREYKPPEKKEDVPPDELRRLMTNPNIVVRVGDGNGNLVAQVNGHVYQGNPSYWYADLILDPGEDYTLTAVLTVAMVEYSDSCDNIDVSETPAIMPGSSSCPAGDRYTPPPVRVAELLRTETGTCAFVHGLDAMECRIHRVHRKRLTAGGRAYRWVLGKPDKLATVSVLGNTWTATYDSTGLPRMYALRVTVYRYATGKVRGSNVTRVYT